MSHQLINLNSDLKKLRDEGYEIEIHGAYLLMHHVPYVNGSKEVKYGTLVCALELITDLKVSKPSTHVICFSGDYPCNNDGTPIKQIENETKDEILFDDFTIKHKFSNKPPNGYDDYYHKFSRYAEIISGAAKSLDKTATEKTFTVIPDKNLETVFHYIDTNSSRANINVINSKFENQKIAIIGLGGTGAYILDLVAKTPVKEIHLFDGNMFLQHNAFRSPGAASAEQLNLKNTKVDYYAGIYSNMHKGIVPHSYYMTEETYNQLHGMSYVFICVDKNSVRKKIIDYLITLKIPFIDVGLGVNIVKDSLIGTVRVTSGTEFKNDHIYNRISGVDNDDNDYSTNIQIAELNSLNATLAVIKWKKMSLFYHDHENEHHCTYSLNVAQLINEDFTI